jgi:hypothetical protein
LRSFVRPTRAHPLLHPLPLVARGSVRTKAIQTDLVLLGICPGHCGSLSRHRIMEAQQVELLGHHRCLCTQLPFGGAGGSLCARRSTESRYRGRGGIGSPHHSAGSASLLPACFGSCRTTIFARTVRRFYSRTSWNRTSRKFAFPEFSEVRMVRIVGGCGLKPQDKRRRP